MNGINVHSTIFARTLASLYGTKIHFHGYISGQVVVSLADLTIPSTCIIEVQNWSLGTTQSKICDILA